MIMMIVAPLPIIIKVNTRKTTGIPMDELMETTRDDPNAMLHPSGRFVKPIMHHQARLLRKYVSQCQISIMAISFENLGAFPWSGGREHCFTPRR
jgi:hypothetical protein